MSSLRLSVCIATFNRGGFIGETLNSLIAQATEDVEIVVLDGGSSDNTREVVESHQRGFQRLRYIRQQTNLGVDKDFDTAVSLAGGEYCWLMSDDDLILPGAVATVLAAAAKGYSLIIANAEVRNSNMSAVLQRRRLKHARDREYGPSDMDRLFADTGDYLTFIGCVIIRRSVWMERERERYFGSLFIHVGVIFQRQLPGDTLVLAEPLISIRYGNAMWRPAQFEIWMFKWPTLVWSLEGPSAGAKPAVCAAEPWRSVKSLMLYRAKGTYSLREYRRMLRPRLGSVWMRICPIMIALAPGTAVNLLALVYYRLARGEKGMGLLEMRNSRFHFRNWRIQPRRSKIA
jgi:abequosyltransferase